ncbi:uncharacterized protein J8A68_004027 [[Candida] subhashii]|uniref:Phosphatidic acid phosphatase type 2/haloperoxidase domain-containing protein n=1 Tax=[Candida] subhashii TaxID=561895 RepID=A0A8J5QC63_9ASCO|nr:uncharacterized protein J8A68_004027 [[Candida] subhashii]KAG7662496.1 hypothetical protein J8A68_004027 [[Candida] subhashii]
MTLGTIIPPIFHEFSLFDLSLRYAYRTEAQAAIPMPLLVFISGGIPILQFGFFSIFSPRTFAIRRRIWDFISGLICLLGAMATQLMATCILKNITGLPRPDLISRCDPIGPAIPPVDPMVLSTVAICTQPDWNLVMEGFRSFPSGHSSAVFCAMTITSLNIAARLHTFDNRHNSFKVFLTIAPIMLACFVAASRVSDNRHFLRDIIAGSLIGVYVGSFFYWQYFPQVGNLRNYGRAYPPRRIGIHNFFNNVGGFWKIDNDPLRGGADQERVLDGQDNSYLEKLTQEYLSNHPAIQDFFNDERQPPTMADNIVLVNLLNEIVTDPIDL